MKHLLNYIAVPKGEHDIRMVYDGTKGGLNAEMWAPNFFLPTAEQALLPLTYSSFCVDLDLFNSHS